METASKINHHVDIGIKSPNSNQILAAKKMTIRDRFLNVIFGKGHQMVILVPGEKVGTISITKIEDEKERRKR